MKGVVIGILLGIVLALVVSCTKRDLGEDCVLKDNITLFNTGFRDTVTHDPNRKIGDEVIRYNADGTQQRWIVDKLKVCYLD